MSNGNFADVNGQHILQRAWRRQAAHSSPGHRPRTALVDWPRWPRGGGCSPSTSRGMGVRRALPLRNETMGDDIAALIRHLKFGKADVMGYLLGAGAAADRAGIRHTGAGSTGSCLCPGRCGRTALSGGREGLR